MISKPSIFVIFKGCLGRSLTRTQSQMQEKIWELFLGSAGSSLAVPITCTHKILQRSRCEISFLNLIFYSINLGYYVSYILFDIYVCMKLYACIRMKVF